MLQTKGEIRNQSPDWHLIAGDKPRFRREIASAVESPKRQLFLRYQPVMNIKSGEIYCLEVLLAWRHPTHGRLNTEKVVNFAERENLMPLLTSWVMSQAISETSALILDEELTLAINIPPIELLSQTFLLQIQALLESNAIPANRIVFEITERSSCENLAALKARINELRSLGFRFALDDYGIGYSGLLRLRDIPVDQIKIDQQFAKNLDSSPSNRAIIASTIDLASELDVLTIVEGIETQSCKDELLELGCSYGQGYYLEKPMLIHELIEWIGK